MPGAFKLDHLQHENFPTFDLHTGVIFSFLDAARAKNCITNANYVARHSL